MRTRRTGKQTENVAEPDTKKQKQELPSAASAPSPEPCEAAEDKEEEEWNLNNADDRRSYIEYTFHTKKLKHMASQWTCFRKFASFIVIFCATGARQKRP